MFKKGQWELPFIRSFKNRLQRVSDEIQVNVRRMVQLEYGLMLLAKLPIQSESVLCLPDLLTLHELPALKHLNPDDWRIIRFARYRIPRYTSRQNWYDDLREYTRLPDRVQLFNIDKNSNFEEVTIAAIEKGVENWNDIEAYIPVLYERPPYRIYSYNPAEGGQKVQFFIEAQGSYKRHLTEVVLPESVTSNSPKWTKELQNIGDKNQVEAFALKRQKPRRHHFVIDEKENLEEAKIMQRKDSKRNWLERVQNMTLTTHQSTDSKAIVVDGSAHIAGMVGSGKSTTVKIIIHQIIRTTTDTIITVIVPSTVEAFNFANEINQLFGLTVDDTPVAVAYYGWSNRDNHIQAFLNENGADDTHTGHRWVSTSCALASLIHPTEIVQMEAPPRPGSEPCERLSTATPVVELDSDEEIPEIDNKTYACPYFSSCPSRQLTHDLETARVIVTTAGGLQSRLPGYFDPRRLLLADYIYERSDIVFVDEADEVQAFQDDQFVNSVPLWRLPNALFSSTDASVSQALVYEALNEIEENWSFSVRDGAKYILPMLRMLNQVGSTSLRRWLGRSYFSAHRLFHSLARRMLGIPDWVPLSDMTQEQEERYHFLGNIFSLLASGDFTKLPDPDYVSRENVLYYGPLIEVWYACKLRDILSNATNNIPKQFLDDLEALVHRVLREGNLKQDLGHNLECLHIRLTEAANDEKITYLSSDRETVETFIQKLMFALLAAGIDREIASLVYNMEARPANITNLDASNFNPNFRSEHKVLPLAYTGPVFGTYFVPNEREPEKYSGQRGTHESLSRLEYINPGRELLLRFHELYYPFNIHGPHTVFLSGTSHLPDSTRWHIRTPVTAVLEANPEWRKTIREESHYAFEPAFFEDEKGRKHPIRVSGATGQSDDYDQAKVDALRQIARYWSKEKTMEKELAGLRNSGALWNQRERILLFVNSYKQAKVLGEFIRQYTNDNEYFTKTQVEWLKPNSDDSYGGIARSSIENISKTNLKILVAPILAIGRGHNILTEDGKQAAFGATYFVVRPLTPPDDVNGIAAEINAYGAQWLEKPPSTLLEKRTIREQETHLRHLTRSHWLEAEKRSYYKYLSEDERKDLAATTFGRFVQASGRLVRGGVPMRVRFIDAAWAPESAEWMAKPSHRILDTVETSLLVAMIRQLESYVSDTDPIGQLLYEPFIGLADIENLRRRNH